MTVFTTHSEDETIRLGERLSKTLVRPVLVLLIGQLGSGKTTLSKGIVKGFGIHPDEVSSPTFTLIHDYGNAIYHVDLYRLDTWSEVESLGLDELLDTDSIVLVEWGERFPQLLARASILIRLYAAEDDRRIQVESRA